MTTRTAVANAAPMPPTDDPKRSTTQAEAGAAAVLAAIGTAEAAAAETDADVALLAVRPRWLAARAMIDAVTVEAYPDQEEREARLHEACRVEDAVIDEVTAMHARTLPGVAFKAEISRVNDHAEPRLVASVMADVEALARETAAADEPCTIEDYAESTFEACATREDIKALRPVFEQNWEPLVFAIGILTKDSDEVEKAAKAMTAGGDEGLLIKLTENIGAGSRWFRQTADLMEAAEFRLVCGAARAAKKAA